LASGGVRTKIQTIGYAIVVVVGVASIANAVIVEVELIHVASVRAIINDAGITCETRITVSIEVRIRATVTDVPGIILIQIRLFQNSWCRARN
jgi:hypothetical protein